MKLHTLFLTSNLNDFVVNKNNLIKFHYNEIQLDLLNKNIKINDSGKEIPVRDFIESDIIAYIDFWYPETRINTGNEKYRLRRIVSENVFNKYALRDRRGNIVHGVLNNRTWADPRIPGYDDFVVNLLPSDPKIKFLKVDDGMIHRHGYHKYALSVEEENDFTQKQFQLYDKLRGKFRIVVNGAWEPENPYSKNWEYPAMPHVDGVQMEVAVGPYSLGSSTRVGWKHYKDDEVNRIVFNWLNNNKTVIVTLRYNPNTRRGINSPDDLLTKYLVNFSDFLSYDNFVISFNYVNYHNAYWTPLLNKYARKEKKDVDISSFFNIENIDFYSIINDDPIRVLVKYKNDRNYYVVYYDDIEGVVKKDIV